MTDLLNTVFNYMAGIQEIDPYVGGMIFAIALGLPTGLSVVWALRDYNSPPVRDESMWNEDWDLDEDM